MRQSLGLSAYRALTRRTQSQPHAPKMPRPKGELVWIHAPEAASAQAVKDLAHRLKAERFGLHVLITSDLPHTFADTEHYDLVPSEHPSDVAAFLDQWRPDAVLWLWGGLRPNLILDASAKGLPMILADAGQDGFENRRDRWLPEVARDVLACFEHVLARSDSAMARLLKLVRQTDTLELSAPLLPGGPPLPYPQSDFDELAQCLNGRPLWLAAAVQPAEVGVVLAAHREASRLSHRLLLVLNPACESQADDCARLIAAEGLRMARWDDGAFPSDADQVLLASAQDELGLWYRVAPLSFLGSSLHAGQGGLDPYRAAALGTAILYGPNIRDHLAGYSRLAAAGAARIVNDASALGTAVTRLIAPDHAASMALAGWDVVSEGADVSDRIVELIQAALDAKEQGIADARP